MFFFVCTMKLIFLHFTYLYGTWCIPFRNCWSYERTKFCSRSFRTLTWRKLVPRLLDTRLVCILAPIKWLAIFSTSVWDFGSFLLGYPHITQFEWLQKIQNKWLFFIFSNNNVDFRFFPFLVILLLTVWVAVDSKFKPLYLKAFLSYNSWHIRGNKINNIYTHLVKVEASFFSFFNQELLSLVPTNRVKSMNFYFYLLTFAIKSIVTL